MGISAEERIKQLIELERAKRKEIADKKHELEKKKKEVEELEKSGKKEIAEAQQEIEEQIEELVIDEKKKYAELEKARLKRENLEEKLGVNDKSDDKKEISKPRGYGDVVDQVIRGNTNFYNLTDYNVVNRLESIAGEATHRPLTNAEKEFVEIVAYHAKELARDDFYKDKAGANYLKKELAQIDFINKLAKKSSGSDTTQNSEYNV